MEEIVTIICLNKIDLIMHAIKSLSFMPSKLIEIKA